MFDLVTLSQRATDLDFIHLAELEVSQANVSGSTLGCDPDQPGEQKEALTLLLC